MSNSRGVRSDDQELVEQVAPHVYKVCPPASELRAPAQKDVPCPVIDCNKVCKQPSALRFHLERVHKIYRKKQKWELDSEKPTVQWHCPEPQCVYAMTQKRYFTSRTLLKQHYGKLHLEKTLRCDDCGKMFGLEKDLKRHMSNNCTMVYTCTCGSIYMHRESYLMHCSRKKHPVKEEYKAKREVQSDAKGKMDLPQNGSSSDRGKSTGNSPAIVNKPEKQKEKAKPSSSNTPKSHNKFKPILPNPNVLILVNIISEKAASDTGKPVSDVVPSQLIYIADARSSNINHTVDRSVMKSARTSDSAVAKCSFGLQNGRKESQHDSVISVPETPTMKQNRCLTSGEERPSKKRTAKSSACTQTSSTRHKHIAAQTQTSGDLILRQAMRSADIPTRRESRASQVSPQAKVKRSSDWRCVQSAETQTASRMHTRHRPRRVVSRLVSMGTNTTSPAIGKSRADVFSVQNPWPLSDMETQTNTSLDEFRTHFAGASTATQTLESFLLNDPVSSASSRDDLSQDVMSAGFNTLATTMDQGVLCDLGLMPGLAQSAEDNRNLSFPKTKPADDTARSLANAQFSENHSALAYTETAVALNEASERAREDLSVDGLAKLSGRQNFNGSELDSSLYRTKLHPGDEGLNSCQQSATDACQLLFPQDSLLGDSNMPAPVKASITDSLQTDSVAQTSITDLSFPDLLTSGVQTSEFDTSYMNIETQTVDESVIDQLLNSMETQTSDDFFADFGFSDIETQTQLSLVTLDDPSQVVGMTTEARETQTLVNSVDSQLAGSSVGIQAGLADSSMMLPLMLDTPGSQATDSIGIQTQLAGDMTQETSSFSVGIQTQQNLDLSAPVMDTETQTLHTCMELCPDLSDSYTQTAFDDLVSFVDTLSNI